jgi:hypothetical protein
MCIYTQTSRCRDLSLAEYMFSKISVLLYTFRKTDGYVCDSLGSIFPLYSCNTVVQLWHWAPLTRLGFLGSPPSWIPKGKVNRDCPGYWVVETASMVIEVLTRLLSRKFCSKTEPSYCNCHTSLWIVCFATTLSVSLKPKQFLLSAQQSLSLCLPSQYLALFSL